MPKFDDEDFEADQDLSILEEARRIKEDNERINRAKGRIEERRRELDSLAERLDEPDAIPEVVRLGGLDKNGQ